MERIVVPIETMEKVTNIMTQLPWAQVNQVLMELQQSAQPYDEGQIDGTDDVPVGGPSDCADGSDSGSDSLHREDQE